MSYGRLVFFYFLFLYSVFWLEHLTLFEGQRQLVIKSTEIIRLIENAIQISSKSSCGPAAAQGFAVIPDYNKFALISDKDSLCVV